MLRVQDCWKHDPEQRPTFEQILGRLSTMDAVLERPQNGIEIERRITDTIKTGSNRTVTMLHRWKSSASHRRIEATVCMWYVCMCASIYAYACGVRAWCGGCNNVY